MMDIGKVPDMEDVELPQQSDDEIVADDQDEIPTVTDLGSVNGPEANSDQRAQTVPTDPRNKVKKNNMGDSAGKPMRVMGQMIYGHLEEENDLDDIYRPEGSLTLVVDNFTEFCRGQPDLQQRLSKPIFVRGLPWRILAIPSGRDMPRSQTNKTVKSLGFFLQCNGDSEQVAWNCNATATLRVIGLQPNSEDHVRKISHTFYPKENDWGYAQFLQCDLLANPENGYILHDKIKLKVHVMADAPHGTHWDSKKHAGYIGLKNQGATCYMNSILQTLFFTNKLRSAVYQMPTRDDPETDEHNVALALQRVFFDLQFSEEPVGTKKLTKSFGWDSMETFMQHDVQELCRVLMDNLENKMKDTELESMIPNLFKGQMRSYIKCLHVEKTSDRYEQFYDIQLNVKGKPNIYESFREYCMVERLEGDNKYDAGEFGLQEAEKGVKFMSFPPVLHLQLMRFQYDPMTDSNVKINDRFEFPDVLDLNEFVEDSSEDYTYVLHAVLVHSGDFHGGHYVVFINTGITANETGDVKLRGRWCKFDDDVVSRASYRDAVVANYGGDDNEGPGRVYANAYMLVYIRANRLRDILCHVSEADIPADLRNRFETERDDELRKKKEKQEAHLFTEIILMTQTDILNHHGFEVVDVPAVLDLLSRERVEKSMTVNELYEHLAARLFSNSCLPEPDGPLREPKEPKFDCGDKKLDGVEEMQHDDSRDTSLSPSYAPYQPTPIVNEFDADMNDAYMAEAHDREMLLQGIKQSLDPRHNQRPAEVDDTENIGLMGSPESVEEEYNPENVQCVPTRQIFNSPRGDDDIVTDEDENRMEVNDRPPPPYTPHDDYQDENDENRCVAPPQGGDNNHNRLNRTRAFAKINSGNPLVVSGVAPLVVSVPPYSPQPQRIQDLQRTTDTNRPTRFRLWKFSESKDESISSGILPRHRPSILISYGGEAGEQPVSHVLDPERTLLFIEGPYDPPRSYDGSSDILVFIKYYNGRQVFNVGNLVMNYRRSLEHYYGQMKKLCKLADEDDIRIYEEVAPDKCPLIQNHTDGMSNDAVLLDVMDGVILIVESVRETTPGNNAKVYMHSLFSRLEVDVLYNSETAIAGAIPFSEPFRGSIIYTWTCAELTKYIGEKLGFDQEMVLLWRVSPYNERPAQLVLPNQFKTMRVYDLLGIQGIHDPRKRKVYKVYYTLMPLKLSEMERRRQLKLQVMEDRFQTRDLTVFPEKTGTVQHVLTEVSKSFTFSPNGSHKLRLVYVGTAQNTARVYNVFSEMMSVMELYQKSMTPAMYSVTVKPNELLVPVAHFDREPNRIFGVPFFVKVSTDDSNRSLREKIQNILEVSDSQLDKFKFAIVSNNRINRYIDMSAESSLNLAEFGHVGHGPNHTHNSSLYT